MRFVRTADMRYIGQEYFVNVSVPSDGAFTDKDVAEITDRFHVAYDTQYGHSTPGAPVEFVNLRVAAMGEVVGRTLGRKVEPAGETVPSDTREVIFEGEPRKATIWRRDRLPPGTRLSGPLVVEEETATTVVPPGWTARVDDNANIIITPEEG